MTRFCAAALFLLAGLIPTPSLAADITLSSKTYFLYYQRDLPGGTTQNFAPVYEYLSADAANHAVPFLDPVHLGVNTAGFNADCSNCHAVTGASPVSAAPLCTVCHTAGSPLTLVNCTSCHVSPPDNTSLAAYPNVVGAHAKHLALGAIPGGTNVVYCDTCHNGLGTNTLNHYNRANARPGLNALRVEPGDLTFVSPFPYAAQNGTVAFDDTLAALSCAAIKCHGGATPTPNWQTGTIVITLNAGCRSCHKAATVGAPQFNDVTNNVHPTHITHAFPGTVPG
jgi:predicted CxxxxCH...CXXCH cytochrome family protein